jgi:hypothetical protein
MTRQEVAVAQSHVEVWKFIVGGLATTFSFWRTTFGFGPVLLRRSTEDGAPPPTPC